MNTFLQPGGVLELAAPTGGCTSGVGYLIGGFFCIATVTAAAGARANFMVVGVHTLAKTSGETWTEGQPAFWDATNLKVSTDATIGVPIGAVALAAASADVTGSVRLAGTPLSGRLLTIRKRFTIASVNAGTTLVPAIPGAKIRMVDASAIAVGGAAGAVTTVDINATLSTSRKLVSFAQASLTQSALLRAGGAGAAILADGASFTPNDANTAITVGVTGSAITTATNIDFSFSYQLEA